MIRAVLIELLRFSLVILVLSLSIGTLSFLSDAWQRNEFVLNRPLVLLMIGVDDKGAGKRGRADSITLAFLDFRRRRLSLLSIPRDTYTEVPGLGYSRINAAYARGGAPSLIQSLETLLGRKVDHTMALDFIAFEKAVNLVGGVQMNVEKDMDYEDRAQNLAIHIKKGRQKMDGATALQYARFRVERGGDIDRIKNQQKLLRALYARMADLHTIHRWPSWYSALRPYLDTDVDPQDLLAFANLLSSGGDSVAMKTLPGSFATPYWRPDVVESRKLMEGYF